jgi:hypothetical protein
MHCYRTNPIEYEHLVDVASKLIWVHGSPGRYHLLMEPWMVPFKVERRFGERHDHGINSRSHDTHQDVGNRCTDEERHEERDCGSSATKFFHPAWIQFAKKESDAASHEADYKRYQATDAEDKVIINNGRPAALDEQIHDPLAGRQVIVAVQSNVDVSPLVKVGDDLLQKGKQAFQDAEQQRITMTVLASMSDQMVGDLQYCREQAAQANTAEGIGRGALGRISNGRGAKARSLVGGKPPLMSDIRSSRCNVM